jgi:hypothetical protein
MDQMARVSREARAGLYGGGGDPDGAGRMLSSLVGAALSVEPAAFAKPGRGAARISYARQVALYLAHTTLGLNYTEAGRLFGRDRSTAAHACRRIEDRREARRVDELVDRLERATRASIVGASGRGRTS